APVEEGIGVHAYSLIEFDLPEGAKRFEAIGALDDWTIGQPQGGTLEFLIYAVPDERINDSNTETIPVGLGELGINGPARFVDLWSGEDAGVATGVFRAEVPWHGARLFRVSPE